MVAEWSPMAAFRFIHTADWQMGMRATGLGTAAAGVRAERLASASRVVDAARQHAAECILITGDLFEDNGVEPLLVQQVLDVLGDAPCPVYVLPGNHDPLVAGSVYDREAFAPRRAGRVTVLRSPEPLQPRDGVTLYPCPYRARRVREDLTAWIPPREPGDGGIRIGVAHGSLRGVAGAEDESACPIDPAAAQARGLDYLALGHWHSALNLAEARLAYAGSHEPTRFGERDSGNVLLVEVAGAGAPPSVRAIRTGGLLWRQEAWEVRSAEDLAAGRDRLAAEDPAEARRTLLELRLDGVATADMWERIHQDLSPLLTARYRFARLVLDELRLAPAEAELLAIAPEGPVRAACERLLAMDSPEARLALIELYALARGLPA